MRKQLVLLPMYAIAALLLAACGGTNGTKPPERSGAITITSPVNGTVMGPGGTLHVTGSVQLGDLAHVTLDSVPADVVFHDSPVDSRHAWRTSFPNMTPGEHQVTATADDLPGGPHTATVTVKVDRNIANGRWMGPNAMVMEYFDEREDLVLLVEADYDAGTFEMSRRNAVVHEGTTDDWDLVFESGFRVDGTFVAKGEMSSDGTVATENRVEYEGTNTEGGYSLTGWATVVDPD